MLAFVVGGLARSASSRSDMAGWRSRSRAASCSGLEQRLERAGGAQPARRIELPLGRAGRAHEVRVVGIREPVRLGAHLRDHAPLLEREHRVDDAGREQVALDLLPSLRIGARVASRSSTLSRTSSADATLRRNDAPAGVGVRTSRCGDRGPVSEPPPRNAPRR